MQRPAISAVTGLQGRERRSQAGVLWAIHLLPSVVLVAAAGCAHARVLLLLDVMAAAGRAHARVLQLLDVVAAAGCAGAQVLLSLVMLKVAAPHKPLSMALCGVALPCRGHCRCAVVISE